MDWSNSEIIAGNGQKYRIGWDAHGWFSMVQVDVYPKETAINATGEETIEFLGQECIVDERGPIHSIAPDDIETVKRLIDEGA